jgi:hypothetical protein
MNMTEWEESRAAQTAQLERELLHALRKVDMLRGIVDQLTEALKTATNTPRQSDPGVCCELFEAAAEVEKWWLNVGMHMPGFTGAPLAIFSIRAAVARARGETRDR